MTPKQTIERMSSTQQYSSVDSQVVYKWHRRFQRNGKRVALKEGQTTELNQKDSQRQYPTLSGATGDVRKILIIRPLFYRI